jgi:hypothetical protein
LGDFDLAALGAVGFGHINLQHPELDDDAVKAAADA